MLGDVVSFVSEMIFYASGHFILEVRTSFSNAVNTV